MPTAEAMLRRKGSTVVAVDPTATVLEAANVMNAHQIGSVVVCEGERLVGIFTERDILRRIVAKQREPSATRVGEVMTSTVACCSPRTRLEEIRALMRERRIRHVPVVDDKDDRVIGMISIGDLNQAEHEQQEETIRYMEAYIYHP